MIAAKNSTASLAHLLIGVGYTGLAHLHFIKLFNYWQVVVLVGWVSHGHQMARNDVLPSSKLVSAYLNRTD